MGTVSICLPSNNRNRNHREKYKANIEANIDIEIEIEMERIGKNLCITKNQRQIGMEIINRITSKTQTII